MGWGDEIIASAQARALQKHDPRPVLVIDRFARPRWSPIWENNPRIARDRCEPFQTLLNAPRARPYIEGKTATHWIWRNSFRAEPGELYLSDDEKALAEPWRGRVLIEPNIKGRPEAVNKAWLWPRWQAVADQCGVGRWPPVCGLRFLQVGPFGTQLLDGVEYVETKTFREACAVLSVCNAYVGPEGGLHHAAAALGVPAVVLFSGFISPTTTGYRAHRNIYHGGAACGARLPCLHCQESMAAISVGEVVRNLAEIL